MNVRCVYTDGTSLEFSQDDASPYLDLDRSKLESVVLLSEAGDELYSISIPDGYTFAYRTRSHVGVNSGELQEKYTIFGLVNSENQILHFIDKDGNLADVIDTPEEFDKWGKLELRQDEAI
jgi:hypothetical protein